MPFRSTALQNCFQYQTCNALKAPIFSALESSAPNSKNKRNTPIIPLMYFPFPSLFFLVEKPDQQQFVLHTQKWISTVADFIKQVNHPCYPGMPKHFLALLRVLYKENLGADSSGLCELTDDFNCAMQQDPNHLLTVGEEGFFGKFLALERKSL